MNFITSKDFLAGLLFVAFGVVGVWVGTDYRPGTAARMGPGYMPRLLCWTLVALGAVIMIQGVLKHERIERGKWRPILWITLAIIAFAFLIDGAALTLPFVGATIPFPKLGLVIAGALLLVVGSYGGPEFNVKEVAVLTVLLLVMCWGIFIKGLGLPIAALPGS